MKSVNLNGKEVGNWKEYLTYKFPNSEFTVERIDEDDKFLESYRITRTDNASETEIIFRIHIDGIDYVELFDVHFNHPKSPELTNENKNNDYGFDGQGSTFSQKHVEELEDWLAIPIERGWTERTTYINNKKIKTECIWLQRGKENAIPIKQDYLNNYGCLMAPIIPLKTFLIARKIRQHPEQVKIQEETIEPMKYR